MGNPSDEVRTRSLLKNIYNNLAFISQIELKNICEAKIGENRMIAMQKELNQFEKNEVWELVPELIKQTIIGTKWIYRNKMDENVIIVRNKIRLTTQRFNKKEGIDYEETFALIV